MAGTPKRQPPDATQPFTGYVPKNFFPNWPNGPMVPPQSFFDLNVKNEEGHFAAVEAVRQLVLDYGQFLTAKRWTQQRFADEVGVTDQQIRQLRDGDLFPSWRTWMLARAMVPPRE